MSASPPPTWSSAAPPNRWGAGRVVTLVLGSLLLLPALAFLAGGGALLWADSAKRSADGYLMSPGTRLSSPGHALVSDRIDVSTEGDWVPVSAALGTARVQVSGAGPELFVGIAPTNQVAAYLGSVQRTVVDELGTEAVATGRQLPGAAPAAPPGTQRFWVEQSSGAGRQQLTWEPARGDWTLVVMNADGSAGVNADLRVGATVPALTRLAWGLLAVGLLLALVAGLVVSLAVRRRSRPQPPPGQPVPDSVPAGPPPTWQPPATR